MARVMRRLARLGRDSDGVAAIEFAVIAPAFILILVGIADFSQYFLLKSEVTHVAYDTGRRLALGDLDGAAASAHVAKRLGGWKIVPVVTTSETATDVTVAVHVPLAKTGIFSVSDVFVDKTIDVSSTFRKQ